ncbi:MAG: lantibiotic dehydratase family protein, partial [Acidobacteria bacterium]|nr:lantibiotic dehydratase family protein [Acidobacteriota bacterium]
MPSPPKWIGEILTSGFFALRTPLLPFDDILRWGEGLQAPSCLADEASLARALEADRTLLRSRLRESLERPEIREAIFIASPDLDESLEVWRRDPEGERGQRVERALVRYFVRMAGRPTPFGLFAGCSVGTLGDQTRLRLENRGQHRRYTRLDMDYLCTLTDALGRDPVL